MGSKDYRHREGKKVKRSVKKPYAPEVAPTPVAVDVIKKGKKEARTEQD
jgi:hypothetical protein